MIDIDAVQTRYLEQEISDNGHVCGEHNPANALKKVKTSDALKCSYYPKGWYSSWSMGY